MKIHLETARIRLREFCEDDASLLFDLDSDPQVMRYIGKPLENLEAYRELIRDRILKVYRNFPGYGTWAIEEKPSSEFIGWILLRPARMHRFADILAFGDEELELGYRLRRKFWGQGIATEASRAIINKALTECGLKLEQIVATALSGNRASTRVMEKVGLKRAAGEYAMPGYPEPAVIYRGWQPPT